MRVDFVLIENEVIFSWKMPMPPRVGEEISRPGSGPNFVVERVEYIDHKGHETGVDCGAICYLKD